jgi:hypothetical protein
MSDKETESQDLKAFEAALAALRPRTDRLDSRFRDFLVNSFSSPVGRGAGGEGCDAGRHRFICIYCGSDPPVDDGIRRWAWPAAFSTMTAVAAILLALLATRSEPKIALQEDGKGTAQQSAINNPGEGRAFGYGLAEANASRPPVVLGTDEMSYLTLRDQVLRDGVESWKFPVSTSATAARTTERPLSYREQLDRLLKQQDLRGS